MKYIKEHNIWMVENIEDIDTVFKLFENIPNIDRLTFCWPSMGIPTKYAAFRDDSSIWLTSAIMDNNNDIALTSTGDSKSTYVVIDTESELYSNVADVVMLSWV